MKQAKPANLHADGTDAIRVTTDPKTTHSNTFFNAAYLSENQQKILAAIGRFLVVNNASFLTAI